MKIPKNYDVVNKDCPDPSSGANFTEYKGIQPSTKAVAETAGEKASNDTSAMSSNKKQPFGKGGAGYTND